MKRIAPMIAATLLVAVTGFGQAEDEDLPRADVSTLFKCSLGRTSSTKLPRTLDRPMST